MVMTSTMLCGWRREVERKFSDFIGTFSSFNCCSGSRGLTSDDFCLEVHPEKPQTALLASRWGLLANVNYFAKWPSECSGPGGLGNDWLERWWWTLCNVHTRHSVQCTMYNVQCVNLTKLDSRSRAVCGAKS